MDSLQHPVLHSRKIWDAIVIGAGPAGSSAAFHLSSCGREVVVFERERFPRDKSCGDGLTPHCLKLLHEMGVLQHLPEAQRISGVRVFMKGRGARDFLYPDTRNPDRHGLVVPRKILDHAICRAAVDAGATLQEGTAVTGLLSENGRITGIEAKDAEGRVLSLRSRIVIAADGAISRFAKQAVPRRPPGNQLGIAVRGYFASVSGLNDFLEIYLPLTDSTDTYVLPSYAWIFPTGPETANVGVGVFQPAFDQKVNDLYTRFVAELMAHDPRFCHAQRLGRVLGAPLRFDFEPERCAAPGILFVGDAAGLISPFTGEGISYALESGKLAADAIHRCLELSPDAPPIEDDYRAIIEHRFAGYFEAGRRSARKYQLIWHVLENSFQSDRPIFNLFRRLILIPEGVGSPIEPEVLEDISPLIPKHGLRVREDLVKVGIALTKTVREEWPFLSRLSVGQRSTGSLSLRPALLLLLAAHFGEPSSDSLVSLAAAVELGYLSILAQSGIQEDATSPDEPGANNWGNRFAILLSDFLIAKSYQMSGAVSAAMSTRIAEAVARACTGYLQETDRARQLDLTETEHIQIIETKFATLFQLPCLLGAECSGAAFACEALGEYGHNLGIAYVLTEDVLVFEQPEEKRLSSAFASDLRQGILSLPIIRALRPENVRREELSRLLCADSLDMAAIIRAVRESGVLESVRTTARAYADSARSVLAALPASSARVALERLTNYAITRVTSNEQTL